MYTQNALFIELIVGNYIHRGSEISHDLRYNANTSEENVSLSFKCSLSLIGILVRLYIYLPLRSVLKYVIMSCVSTCVTNAFHFYTPIHVYIVEFRCVRESIGE